MIAMTYLKLIKASAPASYPHLEYHRLLYRSGSISNHVIKSGIEGRSGTEGIEQVECLRVSSNGVRSRTEGIEQVDCLRVSSNGVIRSGTDGIEQVDCLRVSSNGVIRSGTDGIEQVDCLRVSSNDVIRSRTDGITTSSRHHIIIALASALHGVLKAISLLTTTLFSILSEQLSHVAPVAVVKVADGLG